ncbi:hypothetical protein V1227_11575 [Lentzea sp. DG1S-22]|uniref:hypothetical protein n=1 Tax=Lentzea sp. DG1S-22 TaxID=3108822 RepID=UPI002E79491C|nr:hypothetical protein [Lentzea sp. DG1S-22]WVH83358.1 hypothetical protein V1227_11575 [Lentzea sp. DG1S-22]
MADTARTETDYLELVRSALMHALEVERDDTDLGEDVELVGMPNMSSLAMLRGLIYVEGELGFELADDRLVTVRTIGELAAAIAEQDEESAR